LPRSRGGRSFRPRRAARHPSPRRTAAAEVAEAAPAFAALGDATRLRIVARLCQGGPLSIARLTEGAEVSRQAVTKHLRALEGVGLVRSGRLGRERIWELRTTRLAEIRGYLDEISAQWDDALARLRTFVETDKP
jgi:DNA-binding transcriptional ArsR family regulator